MAADMIEHADAVVLVPVVAATTVADTGLAVVDKWQSLVAGIVHKSRCRIIQRQWIWAHIRKVIFNERKEVSSFPDLVL